MVEDNYRIEPYTLRSFERQRNLLIEELTKLGINITKNEASKITFLSRRKYERYDHFYPGESFDSRLFTWLRARAR